MPPFFYVVSYCHLSATLQTISIIVVNLQDNLAVVRIFIALLRVSVDSPSQLTFPENLKIISNTAVKTSNHAMINTASMLVVTIVRKKLNSQMVENILQNLKCHYCWIKRDQLEVTCFFISLFNAQHVSDISTSILRSLRLIYWVISWVVLLWYDACWCYVTLKPASGYHTTPPQPNHNVTPTGS